MIAGSTPRSARNLVEELSEVERELALLQTCAVTTTSEEPAPAETTGFEFFPFSTQLLSAIRLNYPPPTALQYEVISAALEGKDVLAIATYGSGKTAAYLLPIFAALDARLHYTQGLVVVFAAQSAQVIALECSRLASSLPGTRTMLTTDLTPLGSDIAQLDAAPPHVLVATPVRAAQLASSDHLRLNAHPLIIIDEAELQLTPEVLPQLDYLLATIPHPRQLLMFSSTPAAAVLELSERVQRSPVLVNVPAGSTVPRPAPAVFSGLSTAAAAATHATSASATAALAAKDASRKAEEARLLMAHIRGKLDPKTLATIQSLETQEGS